MDNNANELLTLPQLSRRLKVSQAWVKREAESGRLPCIPANSGRFLFSWSAVEKALLERAEATPEGAAQ